MQTLTYAQALAILYEICSECDSLRTFVSTRQEESHLWDENITKRLDSLEVKIQLVKHLIG